MKNRKKKTIVGGLCLALGLAGLATVSANDRIEKKNYIDGYIVKKANFWSTKVEFRHDAIDSIDTLLILDGSSKFTKLVDWGYDGKVNRMEGAFSSYMRGEGILDGIKDMDAKADAELAKYKKILKIEQD